LEKKQRPKEEFSNAFDEAIQEDRVKRPKAYKNNSLTFRKYITETLKFKEAKKKSASVIGAEGGKKPKINRPILAALDQYLSGNPTATELPNSNISRRFCKKLKSSPMKVIVDGQPFEVSLYCDKITERDLIISTPCGRLDGKTAKDTDKSITCSTFISRYIPCAKKTILNKK